MSSFRERLLVASVFSVVAVAVSVARAVDSTPAELLVGGATISITPERPVALSGQMNTRIARQVESPCMATALALESRRGGEVVGQVVFVSCDLLWISEGVPAAVREKVKDRAAGLDVEKLVFSATHTHTAPLSDEGYYEITDKDVMTAAEYRAFLVDRLAEVVAQAWAARGPGKAGWGLGHAVVGQNRRAVYADGRAEMYGKTDRADFRGIEGGEDHGVEVLFFWDAAGALVATAVQVACPAQEVEGRSAVNADYWHDVREKLRERYGANLLVLGWAGAAGDQSPHLMYRKAAEERMRRLRGLTPLGEIARRIVAGWEEAYEGAKQDVRTDVPITHEVRRLKLPVRLVTDEEYANAKAELKAFEADPAQRWRQKWHGGVIERYERQQAGPPPEYETELHALRIGDVAVVTNDFELFTEYGIRIKARSRALQTFVVQLSGAGTYLPTARAVQGGGYSAIIQSGVIGPEGGRELVDRTVEVIDTLWPEPAGTP